jgi:hypothetical protein
VYQNKRYWYAQKRVQGKKHNIYLGKDLSNANDIITQYCEDNNIFIDERRNDNERLDKLEKQVQFLFDKYNEEFLL